MCCCFHTSIFLLTSEQGHPNPKFLPVKQVSESFQVALSGENGGVTLLQYGRMQGNEALCKEIATWLQNDVGRRRVKPENILITTGSAPGLSLVCQLYTKPGDVSEYVLLPMSHPSLGGSFSRKDARAKEILLGSDDSFLTQHWTYCCFH